jgi:hypothetical protein
MQTLADDAQQEHIATLYYGPNGTGKTTDCAAMARIGPVAYVRADRSVRRRPLERMGIPAARIEPVDTLDTEEIVKLVRGDWAQRLEEDPAALAGVCLDTVSELIARRMEQIVDNEWVKYKRRCKAQREEPDPEKRYFVDRDYWQPITQEMRRIVRHLIDLPCHVAISAQVRRDTDEDDGHVQYGPGVNPAFSGDLMAYMDFVIRTEKDGVWPDGTDVMVGLPRRDRKYHGKDREGVLPSRLVNPTFDRVLAYAQGTIDKDSDEEQGLYRALIKDRASKKRKPKDDDLDDDLED